MRKRESPACLRCSNPAAGACAACHAPTCARCSVVSTETGSMTVLCRSCAGPERPGPSMGRFRENPSRVLYRGLGVYLILFVALGLVATLTYGAPGLKAVLRLFFHPVALFAAVPFAYLLGVLAGGLGRRS